MFTVLFILSIQGIKAQINGEDLNQLSIYELDSMLNRNFNPLQSDEAKKVREEIKNRKNMQEWRSFYQHQLQDAVQKVDFDAASAIKLKLKKIQVIDSLDIELKAAVRFEDFTKASLLSKQKEILFASLYAPEKYLADNVASFNAEETADAVFSLPLSFRKSDPFGITDIEIDGVFYGFIRKNEDLEVRNIPVGKHQILFYTQKYPGNSQKAFYSEEIFEADKSHHIKIIHQKTKKQLKIVRKNNRLKKVEKLNAEKIYSINKQERSSTSAVSHTQLYGNPKFTDDSHKTAKANYANFRTVVSGYKRPLNVSRSIQYNFNSNFTFPVASNLIAGGGFGFGQSQNMFKDTLVSGFSSAASPNNFDHVILDAQFNYINFNIYGIFGFQTDPVDFFSLQVYIQGGPGYQHSYSTVPRQTSASSPSTSFTTFAHEFTTEVNSNVSFNGMLGFNAFFFPNKKKSFGLSLGLSSIFGGRPALSAGVVTGFYKRKYRYKYY